MSRWKASFIHLLLSAAVASLALLLLFFVWYPGPFFRASGGEKLLLLLVGIDLVAGPLLTLIIFNARKRLIKFDLAVIGLAQLGFLVYGLLTMTQARPAFIPFVVDRFVVMPANSLSPEDLAEASEPQFAQVGWTGPKWVFVVQPTDPDEKMRAFNSGMAGKDLEYFPKYYAPYDEHQAEVAARAWPTSLLRGINGESDQRLAELEAKHGAERIGFLPVKAKLAELTVVIDKESAEPIAYLDLNPWSVIQKEMIRKREETAAAVAAEKAAEVAKAAEDAAAEEPTATDDSGTDAEPTAASNEDS